MSDYWKSTRDMSDFPGVQQVTDAKGQQCYAAYDGLCFKFLIVKVTWLFLFSDI